jgi:hypothetical protein
LQFQIDPLSSEFKPSINKLQTDIQNRKETEERREAGEDIQTLGLGLREEKVSGRRTSSHVAGKEDQQSRHR